MLPNELGLTRRQLIAAGAVGAGTLTLSGLSVADGEPVEHNRSMTVQNQQGADLVVSWAEWYNGDQLEAQGTPIDRTNDAPLITLSNVLPGDRGSAHFGLEIDQENSSGDPGELSMLLELNDTAENGITEPEQRAGDVADGGDLQDHVHVRVWYDVGVGGEMVGSMGACDGDVDAGEPIIAEGTLAEVTDDDALGIRTPLDADPFVPDRQCLQPNEQLCVGLEWSVPTDVAQDLNVIQTDSADFSISFGIEQCQNGGGGGNGGQPQGGGQ